MAFGSDGAYGAGDVLAEGGVGLVRAHIEQRLGLAERSGDVVAGLVGIAMVDFGELLGIADEEECGSDAHNRAYDGLNVCLSWQVFLRLCCSCLPYFFVNS